MANHTITLLNYLETYGANSLFDFNYDIFDESYRPILEQMICDFYMFQEIAVIPPERWKHLFRIRFQLAMREYNQLYKSTLIKYNPLITECIEESNTRHDKSKQLSDFGSLLAATAKEHTTNSAFQRSIDKGKLDRDTVGNQTDHNDTDTAYERKLKTDTASTTDVDRDLHQDITEDETTEKDGTKDVIGHSDRKNKTVTDGNTTGTKTHSDYPQANIAATAAENPGNWVTWTEHDTGTAHSEANTDESIDTTENTETSEDIERRLDKANTEVETTATRFDENVTTGIDDSTIKEYNGTIDTTENVKQRTVDTRHAKQDESGNTWNDRESSLATSENKRRETDINGYSVLSGYRNISPAKLIQEYRKAIINVDQKVIDSLATLFMGVW